MKSVIIYFSRRGENIVNGNIVFLTKGNTQVVAEKIHLLTGAPLYEIKATEPYSEVYDTANNRAKREYETNALPEIAGVLPSLGNFDTIYIGFPIWYRTYPRIINTFLQKENLKGKIIKPFCTNDEGSFGTAELELSSYLKNENNVKRGISINGNKLNGCDDILSKWINQ